MYKWKREDADFAQEWEDAEAEAVDRLEQVAWDRAEDNSDRLIEILLKAHRPDKYVQKTVLAGDKDSPLVIDHVSNDANAFLSKLAELAERSKE